MPTKRRILIFLVVLSIMLFAKYVWGQDTAAQSVGWDPQYACGGPSMSDSAIAAATYGPMFGAIWGLGMAWNRHLAARRGKFFTADLVKLEL